jgi:hypothetical protein
LLADTLQAVLLIRMLDLAEEQNTLFGKRELPAVLPQQTNKFFKQKNSRHFSARISWIIFNF